MNLELLFKVMKTIGWCMSFGVSFKFVFFTDKDNPYAIRSLLPLIIGSVLLTASPMVAEFMLISEQFEAMESRSTVQPEGNVNTDISETNKEPDQEITVEIYSDENESKDYTKLIALSVGLLFTVSVPLLAYAFRLYRKNVFKDLVHCDLAAMDTEKLKKLCKKLWSAKTGTKRHASRTGVPQSKGMKNDAI